MKNYITRFGKSNALRKNGDPMWKFIEWVWRNHKQSFQNYMRLTEKLNYHKMYKVKTGNEHLYHEKLTLKYIKWLYRHKLNDLVIFMKQVYPIL